jgi:hypothetical protein
MSTDNVANHRHTVSGKSTSLAGGHAHATAALDARIAAIEARLVALETPVTPPPVEPPPPPPSTDDVPARPIAAPVIARTVTVPATIDPTGATDVTAALIAWIVAQPNGSRLVFPSGAKYRLQSQGIQFANKSDLWLDGAGCTLETIWMSPRDGPYTDNLQIGKAYNGAYSGGCNRIKVSGFHFLQHNPTPGRFSGATEGSNAVLVTGSSNVEIVDCTMAGIGGDMLYMAGGLSTDVWMHRCHSTDNGRQSLSVCGTTNWITFRHNRCDAWGYYCIDIEPTQADYTVANIYFQHNTLGKGGPDLGEGHGFAAIGCNLTWASITGVNITDNEVTGLNSDSTLRTFVNQNSTKRHTGMVFSRNKSAQASSHVAQFKHVDGLTVVGNTQGGVPLALDLIDCTGVVTT